MTGEGIASWVYACGPVTIRHGQSLKVVGVSEQVMCGWLVDSFGAGTQGRHLKQKKVQESEQKGLSREWKCQQRIKEKHSINSK